MSSLPRRLRRLPLDGEVRVAASLRSRLLGLALLPPPPAPVALRLPRTRSVHTAGMRFPVDLEWLNADGRIVRVDRAVPPFRLRTCLRAVAVVERPSTGRR